MEVPPVPTNKEFYNYPWYHGKLSRSNAETILLQNGENPGTFLVRDAVPQTNPPSYKISLLDFVDLKCVVYHYQIYCLDCGLYYIDHDKRFSDIPTLVKWYADNSSPKIPVKFSTPCFLRHFSATNFEDAERTLAKLPEIRRTQIALKEIISSSKLKKIEVWQGSIGCLGVAVKSLSKLAGAEAKLRLYAEAKVLHDVRHSNIIHFIGVVRSNPFSIVTQFHASRDLLTYFLNGEAYETALCQSVRMAREVASALNHISSLQYVHRNVRARNVLLNRDSSCVLSGFGYVARLNKNGKYFKRDDDLPFEDAMFRWMAIESITEERFSTASDVWSFAILLYEIFTKGEMPYADVLTHQVAKSVTLGCRLERVYGIPEGIYNIMTKCWMVDEAMRPTFSDIIEFLKDVVPNEKLRHSESEGKSDKKSTGGKRTTSVSR